jgi:hypothetical protein
MVHPFVYLALLIACCTYAGLRGAAPERIGAAILATGSVLTYAVPSSNAIDYTSVEVGIFLVDVATALAFITLALLANRYWPLWVAALQIIGTAGHAVKLADPETIRRAYAFALIFWSYPMLLLIALGTWRHQQRLARSGADRSWSSFSGRSAPPLQPGSTS